MSKPSKSKVAFGVPPSGGTRGPSSSKVGGSKSTCPVSGTSQTCMKSGTVPKKTKFNIPALSIPPKIPPVDPVLEKLRKKTIRRNAPEGEDLKKIKEIVKGLQKEVVTVQEYVGLISPYTGDRGNVLRTVMGEDLSSFRRMAKRVYDTMTQDVSDVLANEQINLTDYYNERYTLFMDKMMRAIDEIYQYVPNFDFEQYYEDPEEYLKKLFPIRQDLGIDPEEEEMQRRQEAYHRLQWLRSEGTRLNEENSKLQGRLKELKQKQHEERMDSKRQEEMAETRKTHLEATQADLHNQLQDLNESVEKSLICTEEELRLAEDGNLKGRSSRRQMLQASSKTQARIPEEPWNVQTAKIIEEEGFVKTAKSAISSVSVISTSSKSGVKKKQPSKPKLKKKPPPQPRDTSPFHYSPIKTPPPPQARETSPFHYSPPKTPPQQAAPSSPRSTARGGPTVHTVRVESSSRIVEQAPQTRNLPAARRNLAPRDQWGGF